MIGTTLGKSTAMWYWISAIFIYWRLLCFHYARTATGNLIEIFRKLIFFRNYPKEFAISREISLSFLINYLLNWYYALLVTSNHVTTEKHCLLGLFTPKGLGDMCRAFTFVFFLFWFTRKSTDDFPLPFTWIFKDLSKFIFEPMCVQIFRKYLEEKEGG